MKPQDRNNRILDAAGLSAHEALFLLAVSRHMDNSGGRSHPGFSRLCSMARITERRGIDVRAALEARGLLSRESRGARLPPEYRINWEALTPDAASPLNDPRRSVTPDVTSPLPLTQRHPSPLTPRHPDPIMDPLSDPINKPDASAPGIVAPPETPSTTLTPEATADEPRNDPPDLRRPPDPRPPDRPLPPPDAPPARGGRKARGRGEGEPPSTDTPRKARKPAAPPDPRIRRVTDVWAAVYRDRYESTYHWDLGLPGRRSQDRDAAERLIVVARIPEIDGVASLDRLRSAVAAYLTAQDDYRAKGLTAPDARPSFSRFARDAQRWLDAAEASPTSGYGYAPSAAEVSA